MCKWGTEALLAVTIPAHLSHTGVERQDVKAIDSCIARIVQALNEGGITTISSCCGHGKANGIIMLADGRELIMKGDMNMVIEAKELEEAFKQLDARCSSCQGSGQYPLNSGHDCSVCYGTGYQPTRAGIQLLNFLRRQKKRIEREAV